MASRTTTPRRRTQEERSATTRGQLLDATIDALVELGYSATTTTVIAKRAGLSRGAQLHHYPTKAELVAAAVEHLADKLGRELAAQIAESTGAADRLAAAIDTMWSAYSRPLFQAWLELRVAARTDPELLAALVPVETRLRISIGEHARLLFGDELARGNGPLVLAMSVCLMQGMALERTLSPSRPGNTAKQEAEMLATWKRTAAALLFAPD